MIVFEDIHWADEATLDFIKFFARRITQLQCLFILTYRDDEIHSGHPLRNMFWANYLRILLHGSSYCHYQDKQLKKWLKSGDTMVKMFISISRWQSILCYGNTGEL